MQEVGGVAYVLELPLRADFALVRAHCADRLGNLSYRRRAAISTVMATAAEVVVAEVDSMVEAGALDPEQVVTPASSSTASCWPGGAA